MAKAVFTFDEMVYNSVVSGRQIWYDSDSDGKGELLTIDYVKLIKDTRQIQVHCVEKNSKNKPIVFLTDQDAMQVFEVTAEKVAKRPNKKKNKKKKK